ncbi:TenA family transcriptional regulator [Rubrobacter indicoceani]|uniref:TenA family transcriptional regulator n=1 Tax=Rubrobacter indicoceani TaxID=2051957 RepID=UPI000E5BAD96|nr:TenA family transcriptional regulator [Rubrobacter indicoceani]
MDTGDLLKKHDDLWRESWEHEFIVGVREGNLPDGVFDTWLVQDYLFVAGAMSYQARLVPRAPRWDQAPIIGGLVALEQELTWFEGMAKSRGLLLDDMPHPHSAAYVRFLQSLEIESYIVNAVALWAVEQAYLDAWTNAAPGAEDYRDFVEHWTDPKFAEYIGALRSSADRALSRADERQAHRAEDAFVSVARLERDFWNIAYSQVGI